MRWTVNGVQFSFFLWCCIWKDAALEKDIARKNREKKVGCLLWFLFEECIFKQTKGFFFALWAIIGTLTVKGSFRGIIKRVLCWGSFFFGCNCAAGKLVCIWITDKLGCLHFVRGLLCEEFFSEYKKSFVLFKKLGNYGFFKLFFLNVLINEGLIIFVY